MNEREEKTLVNWTDKNFYDSDKIDIFSEMDRSISLEENKRILKERYHEQYLHKEKPQTEWQVTNVKQDTNIWERIKPKVIVAVGCTRSGKTALCYHIIREQRRLTGKKVYFVCHPKPELIRRLGYDNLYSFENIEHIQDAIVYADEPQLHLPVSDRKANNALLKLFTMCGQRNITLILSTADSRYVTKGIEAFVEGWCITDIDYDSIKQGSTIKRAIRDNTVIDPRGFRLVPGQYLFYSRNYPEETGKHSFKKPTYYTEEHSKVYADSEANNEKPAKRVFVKNYA